MLRFHLDENCAVAVAVGLRRRGIDVTTALEGGLAGASDAAQLEFASRESRVLVTHDADFLALHARGVQHAGIAYARQGLVTLGDMIRTLALMAEVLSHEDVQNHVEYL